MVLFEEAILQGLQLLLSLSAEAILQVLLIGCKFLLSLSEVNLANVSPRNITDPGLEGDLCVQS
jgi:hypothetical protein